MKNFLIWLLFVTSIWVQAKQSKMWVCVPVCNMRAQPQPLSSDMRLPLGSKENPLQISQLLFGEYVLVHEKKIDGDGALWYRVSALQQEIIVGDSRVEHCSGWIKAQSVNPVIKHVKQNLIVTALAATMFDDSGKSLGELSIGSRLFGKQISQSLWKITTPDEKGFFMKSKDVYHYEKNVSESIQMLQENVIAKAKEFLGYPYSWGCRSGYCDRWFPWSVDCSGLINLIFLSVGLQVPKNSHSQWVMSKKIVYGKELLPGDLIFFASRNKKAAHMNHVMLYLGDGLVLESADSGKKVRIISFLERIGKDLCAMRSGDLSDKMTYRGVFGAQYNIYFGRLLHCSLIKKLRFAMFMHTY